MDRRASLDRICREHDLLAVYLFGSRADHGLAYLRGADVERDTSDIDIGVILRRPDFAPRCLTLLQVAFEDLFAPFRVDVVALQRVDALFQFDAIDGHRVAVTDAEAADLYELAVMRRAAELLPIELQLERDFFATETP